MNLRDMTLQEGVDSRVAWLQREPKDDQERAEIEHARQLLNDAFMSMARGETRQHQPLPPLAPGRARVASWGYK